MIAPFASLTRPTAQSAIQDHLLLTTEHTREQLYRVIIASEGESPHILLLGSTHIIAILLRFDSFAHFPDFKVQRFERHF